MKEITVSVKFKEELHARPAVKLIKTAAAFDSSVTVRKKDKVVSASSITQILGACIVCGDEITVRAEGSDEEKAIEELARFFA